MRNLLLPPLAALLLTGCPETVAVLGALSPSVEVHEQAWDGRPTDGNDQRAPGECATFVPAVRWYERSSPSTAPAAPIPVAGLAAELLTPEICAMVWDRSRARFVLQGVAEGLCAVEVEYEHPVTKQATSLTVELSFAREPAPPPPALAFERPREYTCSAQLEQLAR